VSRAFGKHFALHRMSCRFTPGQLTVLLGPNGAGKSTLLTLMATLDKPTSGQLRYGPNLGQEQMIAHGRGQIGWVSHDSLLYSDLTARENLVFYGSLYRVPDPEARATELLAEVGLAERDGSVVKELSRGMRQRLSLARALVARPRLLLLDEPFTGLDREGRAQLLSILATSRDGGCIIVLSTHALDLPVDRVDRVLVLRRGKKRFDGEHGGRALSALYEEALAAAGERA
jgi:heme exporter protein A